jgi:hypothetical protein
MSYTYPKYLITDPADVTDEDGVCHVPERDEIRELLVKYFKPPITEQAVDRVEADFRRVSSSRRERLNLAHSLENSRDDLGRWCGTAWLEDFTGERKPTLSDLVLMLANMLADRDPSFPQPRPFCPMACVGTWEQIEPRTPNGERWLWYLSADGAFRCDNPEVSSKLTRWCVRREPGFGFDFMLWKKGCRDGWMMSFVKLHATDIAGEMTIPAKYRAGATSAISMPLRLRRVSRQCSIGDVDRLRTLQPG